MKLRCCALVIATLMMLYASVVSAWPVVVQAPVVDATGLCVEEWNECHVFDCGFNNRCDGSNGTVHAGVDLRGAAGAPVVAPFRGRVRGSANRTDGFGGVVIFEAEDKSVHLFIAHLDPFSLAVPSETVLEAGRALGQVGTTELNGDWLPHVHLAVRYGPYTGRTDITQSIGLYAYVPSDGLCEMANPLALLAGSRTSGFLPNTLSNARIGAGEERSAPAFFFDGLVDELAVYARALPAAEIAEHWAQGSGS